MSLSEEELQKQIAYRDARISGEYDKIWQSVGKCVFCDLSDKYVFYEENGMVMTVALFAYIDGNFMIIPRRHIKSVKDLTDEEWLTVRKFLYIGKKIVRDVHGIKGLNYIIRDGGIVAQSTVSDHLHIHVLPFDAPDLVTWNYRKLKFTPLENANMYKAVEKKIRQLSERFEEKYLGSDVSGQDEKELYLDAFKKTLISKKESRAKNTARVGASVIAQGEVISYCNASLTDDPMEYERDGTWVSTPSVSHAEERCISHAARQGLSLNGATMIVTLSPCMACARLILNAGIQQVHYIDDWWDQNALNFLAENGVKVRKLPYKKKGRKVS